MAGAGDLIIRVKFAGTDRLSQILESVMGKSKAANRALGETNKTLRMQETELRDVQRQLASASGNVTTLIDRERELEAAIARTNGKFERQTKIVEINARTKRITEHAGAIMAAGRSELFSTLAVAAPMLAIAKAGGEFEQYQNKLRVLGLGHGAVDELTAFAAAMNLAGSSVNDNMRYLLEAQGVFRESGEHDMAHQLAGAKLMAPLLAKMHVVAAATGKEMGEDQERYFLRFVEQAGGLTNSKRAAELTDGLFRALQSSGGNVNASNYQGFLAHAGVAGSHLSNRAMFADFEPLIGELHEAAGVGLATAFKMATGIKVNSRAAAEFSKLGLWDKSKIVLNKLGGVKSTNGDPLNDKAANLLQRDPVEFYRQVVLPAYEKNNIKTSEGRAFENAKIFGGTGGNLFNLIDKQLPTILRSRAAYGKTQGLDKAYGEVNDSFFGKEGKLRAAAKDFMVAAGTKGGLLDQMTGLMDKATSALRTFTVFGNAHPTAFRWIGKLVTDLLLLRVGLAVAKIGFGGLIGPAARLWGVFGKIRAAGSIAEAFPMMARAAGLLRTAFLLLGRGVMQAGMMMLANPMVLAIVGIVAAVGLLGGAAYELYQHWGGVTRFFGTLWSGVKSVFSISLLDIWKNLAFFGAYAMGTLWRFGATAWNWLTGTLPGLLVKGWNFAWSALGAALRALPGLLKGAWHFAWSTLGTIIHAAFVTLPTMFADFGVMIIKGLWNGIKSAPSRLWNAGKQLAGAVSDGFKAGAKIQSPSRVFAELGGYLTSGLSRGIDRGAQGPLNRTRSLANRLAAVAAIGASIPVGVPQMAQAMAATAATRVGDRAPRREAAPARSAATAAPVTNHFHMPINAAPGMDERQLADLVARKVDEVLRRQAVRARSRFGDDPDEDSTL